jgi:DNA-binding HxlR family transcriptional regulator
VLSLLATPGTAAVMRVLEAEPMPLAELRRAAGFPPQTTMRAQLRELTALGVLERRREAEFPHSVDYELAEPGRELLAVAGILEPWLAGGPLGPMPLGETAAKRTIKAVAEGWDSGIVSTLAAKPLSLTQLSREISALSYPSLERRLSAMSAAGLIETGESNGHGAPCQPTSWLRHAAAPIAAAARFERRRVAGAREVKADIQALLMLAMPIAQPPAGARGSAMLVTREGGGRIAENDSATVGVTVELENGLLQSCAAGVEEGTPTWALGVPDAWLDAVVDGILSRLRFGGTQPKLATGVAVALHEALREPAQLGTRGRT